MASLPKPVMTSSGHNPTVTVDTQPITNKTHGFALAGCGAVAGGDPGPGWRKRKTPWQGDLDGGGGQGDGLTPTQDEHTNPNS